MAQLEKWITEQMETTNISDIKFFLKLESLVKDEPIITFEQQQARSILAMGYFVAAIFSPMFNIIKQRLKNILKENIVYTDGLRPDQISARTRLARNVEGFFENDLKK